jgi:MFS family permease
MSVWFSASAVVPALKAQYGISGGQAAALSSSVALGFVAGTLLSALLGLADRLDPRRLFTASAVLGAAANGAAVLFAPSSISFIVLRFVVGATIAGIYPVGIKMAATWATADLGLLVGLLVAASTLGNASAFLLAAFGDVDWRSVMLGASGLATLAALLISLFRCGPRVQQATVFRAQYVLTAWRERPLRLANLGYYGHMWELYAMWAWVTAFLQASFQTTPIAKRVADFSQSPTRWPGIITVRLGIALGMMGNTEASTAQRLSVYRTALLIDHGVCIVLGPVATVPQRERPSGTALRKVKMRRHDELRVVGL